MTIFEYNEDQHMQALLEEGYEDGFNNGELTKLVTLLCCKLKKENLLELSLMNLKKIQTQSEHCAILQTVIHPIMMYSRL